MANNSLEAKGILSDWIKNKQSQANSKTNSSARPDSWILEHIANSHEYNDTDQKEIKMEIKWINSDEWEFKIYDNGRGIQLEADKWFDMNPRKSKERGFHRVGAKESSIFGPQKVETVYKSIGDSCLKSTWKFDPIGDVQKGLDMPTLQGPSVTDDPVEIKSIIDQLPQSKGTGTILTQNVKMSYFDFPDLDTLTYQLSYHYKLRHVFLANDCKITMEIIDQNGKKQIKELKYSEPKTIKKVKELKLRPSQLLDSDTLSKGKEFQEDALLEIYKLDNKYWYENNEDYDFNDDSTNLCGIKVYGDYEDIWYNGFFDKKMSNITNKLYLSRFTGSIRWKTLSSLRSDIARNIQSNDRQLNLQAQDLKNLSKLMNSILENLIAEEQKEMAEVEDSESEKIANEMAADWQKHRNDASDPSPKPVPWGKDIISLIPEQINLYTEDSQKAIPMYIYSQKGYELKDVSYSSDDFAEPTSKSIVSDPNFIDDSYERRKITFIPKSEGEKVITVTFENTEGKLISREGKIKVLREKPPEFIPEFFTFENKSYTIAPNKDKSINLSIPSADFENETNGYLNGEGPELIFECDDDEIDIRLEQNFQQDGNNPNFFYAKLKVSGLDVEGLKNKEPRKLKAKFGKLVTDVLLHPQKQSSSKGIEFIFVDKSFLMNTDNKTILQLEKNKNTPHIFLMESQGELNDKLCIFLNHKMWKRDIIQNPDNETKVVINEKLTDILSGYITHNLASNFCKKSVEEGKKIRTDNPAYMDTYEDDLSKEWIPRIKITTDKQLKLHLS